MSRNPEKSRLALYKRLMADPRVNHDDRWIAYIMATVGHETAGTFDPIREYGSEEYFTRRYEKNQKLAKILGNIHKGDGALFCGRGYVQITGRRNYEEFSRILGIDLVANPDRALEPDVAYEIMVIGMTLGKFTGVSIATFINAEKNDPLNARKVINGLDCAEMIANQSGKHLERVLALRGGSDRGEVTA